MFTLSSADVNIPRRPDQEINIPIQFKPSEKKLSEERTTHDTVAACDDDGQIFVYDHNNDESSGT